MVVCRRTLWRNISGPWIPIMTLGVPHMGWNKVTFPIIQSESLSIAIRYPQYIRVRADDPIKTLGLIELRFVGWAVTNTSGERQVVASQLSAFLCVGAQLGTRQRSDTSIHQGTTCCFVEYRTKKVKLRYYYYL